MEKFDSCVYLACSFLTLHTPIKNDIIEHFDFFSAIYSAQDSTALYIY